MSSKIRTKLIKGDRVRFISHLDFKNTLSRALRRAKIPICYSQGYNPRPQVSFGSALAVGLTSDSEYIDFELEREMVPKTFKEDLNSVLPEGIKVVKAEKIPVKTKSLMAQINAGRYLARLELDEELSILAMKEKIKEFLAQDEIKIKRKRRNKKDRILDLKPMIFSLDVIGVKDKLATINMLVQTGSSGNVRPQEVINALADNFDSIRPARLINIHRAGLYVKSKDKLLDPIEVVTS